MCCWLLVWSILYLFIYWFIYLSIFYIYIYIYTGKNFHSIIFQRGRLLKTTNQAASSHQIHIFFCFDPPSCTTSCHWSPKQPAQGQPKLWLVALQMKNGAGRCWLVLFWTNGLGKMDGNDASYVDITIHEIYIFRDFTCLVTCVYWYMMTYECGEIDAQRDVKVIARRTSPLSSDM